MAAKVDKKNAAKIDMLSGLKDMRATRQNIEGQPAAPVEVKKTEDVTPAQVEPENTVIEDPRKDPEVNMKVAARDEASELAAKPKKEITHEVRAAAKEAMEILDLAPRQKKQKKTEHFNFLVTKNRYDQFIALSEQLGTKPNQTFEVIMERIFGPDTMT